MAKRFMALFLSLAMIFSLSANFSMGMAEGASDPVNVVSIKYYADADLTTEKDTFEKGETVYAAVKLNKFTKLYGMTMAVSYDKAYLELLDADGNPAVIDNANASIKDKGYITQEALGSGRQIVNATSSAFFPCLTEKNGIAVIGMMWAASNNTASATFTEETACAIIKFKALKTGRTTLRFPIQDVDEVYSESAPTGINITLRDVNAPLFYADCTVNLNTLTISGQTLAVPANVAIADRKVTWSSVSGAAGYKVTVQVSKNGSVVSEETYNATGTEFALPAGITNGDVKAKVQAISADAEVGNSEYSDWTADVRFTITLSAPANVVWDGQNVKWNAVDGASAYNVSVKLNDSEWEDKGSINDTTFAPDIQAPTGNVTKNSYTVAVKALGDGVYVLDSAAANSPVKNMYGKLNVVTNLRWNGKVAEWDDSNDSASVRGYMVCVLKDGDPVYSNPADQLITQKSINAANWMVDPGYYTFTVIAIGAEMADGKYVDSDVVESARTPVSKTLDPVENAAWDGRAVTWEDNNADTFGYEVTLYKDDEVVDNYPITTTDKNINFADDITGQGTYKAVIVAKGNNETYLDSNPAEAVKIFDAPFLGDPNNLRWNGTTAEWDAGDVATESYEVKLYYNGVEITFENNVVYNGGTSIDLSGELKLPGEYTFSVKGRATGYEDSVAVVSDPMQNVVNTVGKVYIEAFEDEECTTPATNVKVGDIFYAAVSVESFDTADTSDDITFRSFTSPIKFNSDFVKVVNANDEALDGSADFEGAMDGAILWDAAEITGIAPYVDNANGLVKFAGIGSTSDFVVNDKKTLVVVKMMAMQVTDTNNLEFAVANAENPDSYDDSSKSGFAMANTAGQAMFADVVIPNIAIAKGQLAKMAAPVWSGATLTWSPVESAHVVGYEIQLYRNGMPVDTIIVNDPNAASRNLAVNTSTSGIYTAKIKALGDDVGAVDSEYSDASEEYEVKGAASGNGPSSRPSQGGTGTGPVVEPDDEPIFTDIIGHWAEKDILDMVDKGIVDGYGDRTFRPNIGITRAEFTKLMVTCLGVELEGEAKYYDDTANHWAKEYIAIGTEIGIVNGIGNNLFAPDEIITREQIAAIIHRMVGSPEVEASTFADREACSDYAKPAIDYVAANGIMVGYSDNTFGGKKQATRAEMVTVVNRLYKANFFANYKK